MNCKKQKNENVVIEMSAFDELKEQYTSRTTENSVSSKLSSVAATIFDIDHKTELRTHKTLSNFVKIIILFEGKYD